MDELMWDDQAAIKWLTQELNIPEDFHEEVLTWDYENVVVNNYGHSGECYYNSFFYVPETTSLELLTSMKWKVGQMLDLGYIHDYMLNPSLACVENYICN